MALAALHLIEACYAETTDDQSWRDKLVTALSAALGDWSEGVMGAEYRVGVAEGLQIQSIWGDDRFAALVERARRASGTVEQSPYAFARRLNGSPHRLPILRETYGATGPRVIALSELPREHQEPLRQHLPWPHGDTLGVFASLDGSRGLQLGTASPSFQAPSGRRRAELLRLAEHVAVGYWLRQLRSESPGEDGVGRVVAVYAPDGRRLDRAPSGGDRALDARLADAVRRMDRARCQRLKHGPEEAAALWQAFVAGHYTLVERFERGGRRVLLAVKCRAKRTLTPREAAVAQAAARGLPNKLIGAELGMRASTVAVHLSSALRKLGCPSRRLLGVWLVSSRA